MNQDKQPRVLFLRSNPIDPDPRVEKAAHTLLESGYQVSVLGWDRTANLKQLEYVNGIPVVRLDIKAAYGTGMQNLPALLRWQWSCMGWLISHRQAFDILHACDFDTVMPALVMKLLWKKVVLYDIFDYYADHLRATPTWIKSLIRFLDKRCINRVDGVILADDVRREQISWANPRRCTVIYNTPKDHYRQFQPNKPQTGGSHFRLAYVGLLQVERGIFEILEILDRHPDWILDLAGFGGDEAVLRERVSARENVRWHGRVAYQRALEISSQADVLFATYDPAIRNHRYASPNKVFEAMMLAKPIVVARDTNIDRIIKANDCGLVVEYGNVPALEDALTCLSEDKALRSRLSSNARQAYEMKYHWSEMESRLRDLYAAALT